MNMKLDIKVICQKMQFKFKYNYTKECTVQYNSVPKNVRNLPKFNLKIVFFSKTFCSRFYEI